MRQIMARKNEIEIESVFVQQRLLPRKCGLTDYYGCRCFLKRDAAAKVIARARWLSHDNRSTGATGKKFLSRGMQDTISYLEKILTSGLEGDID